MKGVMENFKWFLKFLIILKENGIIFYLFF
jgi:hypothetical protein